ncbi:MFS general substrate transporter [Cristinia sonorae]|uniref:MFS general substrate transporter n=1 Tax=Cristinia sonorae TaxID=1940300 RepID=A0A8K0UY48_9AGAR|nr:MFS general substrate transporter [Cristinia sonorae]
MSVKGTRVDSNDTATEDGTIRDIEQENEKDPYTLPKEDSDSPEGYISKDGQTFASANNAGTEKQTSEIDINETEPPDKGLRAWMVVVGSFCGNFATFGYVNSWGVFQSYYERTLLSTTPPSTIAWIGSIQYSLCFVPGLVTGRLYDKGIVKLPLGLASATLVAGTFITAECKEYWQFLLCQGFFIGFSCGVIFGPAMGLISHWFKKRRGLALGISASGSSLGGTVFPIAARHLIETAGFKWCMRTLGFIQLFALIITNLTLDRRGAPSKVPRKMIDLKAFKSPAYTMWCLSGMVIFLGLYTVLTYIDVSAVSAGLSPSFTFYLVAIANASSSLGRVIGGHIGDRIGPINAMIPPTLIAGGLTYAWPFARTTPHFVVIAIFYGITSGVFVSLINAPFMAMGNPHDVGTKVGMAMTIIAIGAITGPPISGAIYTASGGYKDMGYYAGSVIILSCVMMAISKRLILGQWRGRA